MTGPTSVPDPYAADHELQEYMLAQEAEFAEWVAARDIYFGIALAHRTGDPISKSNVERHGYAKNGLAVKRNSKEGRAITGEAEPVPEKKGKATDEEKAGGNA
jgi:hypothetical protein